MKVIFPFFVIYKYIYLYTYYINIICTYINICNTGKDCWAQFFIQPVSIQSVTFLCSVFVQKVAYPSLPITLGFVVWLPLASVNLEDRMHEGLEVRFRGWSCFLVFMPSSEEVCGPPSLLVAAGRWVAGGVHLPRWSTWNMEPNHPCGLRSSWTKN